MSGLPACVQCGGKEYYAESGFYFCAECQIQSQDIREQLLTGFRGAEEPEALEEIRLSQVEPSEQADRGLDSDRRDLTSWEVLNYVLRGWVEELTRLGVDNKVKITTLQLWALYLNKLDIAFTSSLVQRKPRLGLVYRSSDAELVYGLKKSEAGSLKKAFSSRTSSSAGSHTSSGVSNYFQRRKKRRELAAAVYKEESVVSDMTFTSDVSLEQLSTLKSPKSTSSKICFTSNAKKTMRNLFGRLEDDIRMKEGFEGMKSSLRENAEVVATNYRRACTSERKSIRHLGTSNLLSLLWLAILLSDQRVHLSDLFRWSREGYMSLNSSERLIPQCFKVSPDVKSMLANPVMSWSRVAKGAFKLSNFLNMNILVPLPFLSIVTSLCQRLYLPDDTVDIVKHLLKEYDMKLYLGSGVNYEGRAAAIIIFILKSVYILDGVSEIYSSEAAAVINRGVESERNGGGLLVWKEWVECLELVGAVVSCYHIPTRETLYPGLVLPDTVPAFLGQWSLASDHRIITRAKELNPDLITTLKKILQPLCCQGSEPPKPYLTDYSTLIEYVASRLPSETAAKLSEAINVSKSRSLSIYFHRSRLEEMAERNGCTVRSFELAEMNPIKRFRFTNSLLKLRNKTNSVSIELTGPLLSNDELDGSSSGDEEGVVVKKRKLDYSSDEDSIHSYDEKNTDFLKGVNILPVKGGNVASKVDLGTVSYLTDKQVEGTELYVGFDSYWRLDGSFYSTGISIPEFEELSTGWFSHSFCWLLKKVSSLVDQSMRDVYRELTLLEKIFCGSRGIKTKLRKD